MLIRRFTSSRKTFSASCWLRAGSETLSSSCGKLSSIAGSSGGSSPRCSSSVSSTIMPWSSTFHTSTISSTTDTAAVSASA